VAHLISGAVLIGNKDILTAEARLTAYNPNTGEALEPKFHTAGEDDVRRACDLAWAALDPYRNLPLTQRADFLLAISEEIMALGDDLIQRAIAETGLTRFETERARTCFQLGLFAGVVRRGDWLDLRVDTAMTERQPPRHSDLRLRNISKMQSEPRP
jgi:NADP-dependent aldehyde dehydrogenase